MKTVRTRWTTANVPPGAESDFDTLQFWADVLISQENQQRRISNYLDPKDWVNLQGPRGPKARCAISILRSRVYKVSKWGHPLLHMSHLYKSAVRYFTWVRWQDAYTGRWNTTICVHFGPDADNNVGGISDLPRGKLVHLAIFVLCHFVRLTSFGSVQLGGDFNIDADRDIKHHARSDLIESFERAGLKSSQKVLGNVPDTHGTNAYDQWFMKLVRWTRMVKHVVHQKLKSDHKAYTVITETIPRKGWPRSV